MGASRRWCGRRGMERGPSSAGIRPVVSVGRFHEAWFAHALRTAFLGHAIERHALDDERLLAVSPGFAVHEIGPGPAHPGWAYLTEGCWWVHPDDHHGVEFVLFTDRRSPWCVEHLTMTSYYYAAPPASSPRRLAVGDTFPHGSPVQDGSVLDHYYVSDPYPWDQRLWRFDGWRGHVRVLWTQPISAAERQFKVDHGHEALEDLFEREAISYSNVFRPSVV